MIKIELNVHLCPLVLVFDCVLFLCAYVPFLLLKTTNQDLCFLVITYIPHVHAYICETIIHKTKCSFMGFITVLKKIYTTQIDNEAT
nr:hypothetical protein [Salmonid herpesvirus 1]